MKRHIFTLAMASALFASATAHAGDHKHHPKQSGPEVQLAATGSVEVPHDWVRIVVHTTPTAASQKIVQATLITAIQDASVELSKKTNGKAFRVQPGAFEIYPRYDSKGKVKEWAGRAELVLEGTDFVKISQATGDLKDLTLRSVSYGLSEDSRKKFIDEAETNAVSEFKQQAQSLASKLGYAGYRIQSVEATGNAAAQYPSPKLMRVMMSQVDDDAPQIGMPGVERVTYSLNGVVVLH